jgi:hypothetical protein
MSSPQLETPPRSSSLASLLRLRTAHHALAMLESLSISADSEPEFVGSVDCGTTSCRFYIFDVNGAVVAYHQKDFEQRTSPILMVAPTGPRARRTRPLKLTTSFPTRRSLS